MICVRCRVSGRVQGVWFRASTQREARRLGINGRAVNLADGAVEVIACGEARAISALRDWLWRGPGLARVAAVDCEPLAAPAESYTDFTIG